MTEEHCRVGERLKDKQVDEKRQHLELLVKDSGWDILWRCPQCGKFWEATSEGRYEEREYLTCLEDEEVRLRWPDEFKKHCGQQK